MRTVLSRNLPLTRFHNVYHCDIKLCRFYNLFLRFCLNYLTISSHPPGEHPCTPVYKTEGGILENKRILLVDDEPLILKGLKYSLEQDNYTVDIAVDGESALEKFFTSPSDMILLDIMLPRIDGLAVCQRIREHSNVPIIMLTAKGEDIDKILGLEYGADDYIPKPFNILEVKARIKALFRRVSLTPIYVNSRTDFVVRDLCVSPTKRTVTLKGEELKLSSKELELLLLFLSNRGRVFTRAEILNHIWSNENTGDDRSVDVLIKRLREKIERDTSRPSYILTKWGVGYYFTEQG